MADWRIRIAAMVQSIIGGNQMRQFPIINRPMNRQSAIINRQ
jgi:hypothetical protein